MTDQTPTTPPARQPRKAGPRATPARIRRDIDTGKTGDKTPGLDPAAAPLGSDEEAAGPISPTAEAQARAGEPKAPRPQPHPNAATPELAPDASQPRQGGRMALFGAIGAAVGVGLGVLIYLML